MRATAIIAENRIREAMERGEFDNLGGRGKKIDLEEYFTVPEQYRMAYTLMKNAETGSQEIALMRTLEDLRDALERERDQGRRMRLASRIQEMEHRLRDLAGKPLF